MAGFTFKLEHADGTPAEPPTLKTALPNSRVGDTIPLGRKTLHVVAVLGNPWLADWLLEQALERRTGEPVTLEPLDDALEVDAHRVAAERARARGGRWR
jgi:hypothetical protein